MAYAAVTLALLLLFASLERAPTAATCDAACEEEQSKQILGYRDSTVSPCDNFYLHSCGGFINDAMCDADTASNSTWSRASDKLRIDIHAAIQDMATDTSSPLKGLHRWASGLYELCMNTAALESASLPGLQGLLDEIFPPSLMSSSAPIASRYYESGFQTKLSKSLARLWLLGVDPFFVLDVAQDYLDTSRNSLYLLIQYGDKNGVLVLNEYFSFLKEHYEVFLQEYFDQLFQGGIKRHADASELIKLQEHLVNGWRDPTDCFSPSHCVSSVAEITSVVDFIDWVTFFSELFPSMHRNDILNLRIIFADVSAFRKLNAFIKSRPVSFIFDLALLKLASSDLLPKALRDVNAAFVKQVINTERPPRDEICTERVADSFEWVVSRQYVDAHFDEHSRSVATEILSNVRRAFIDDLQRLTWMDDITRSLAAEKAEAMILKVGYPDWIMNDTELLEYHVRVDGARLADVPVPDTFFMAHYATEEVQRSILLSLQATQVVRTKWLRPPIYLSPYYNNFNNEIVFTAAYLQPPIFDARQPLAYIYGSVGAVMAHELTHGFDDKGHRRDKNGELNNWWSGISEAEFILRTKCYERQYNNYFVTGVGGERLRVDGALTLSENIADNGGIQLSFLALRTLMADVYSNATSADSCAAAGLSPEQLFFYGWAHLWCSKSRPEVIELNLAENEHAPNEFRVIGSVANSKPFAKAFQCTGVTGLPVEGSAHSLAPPPVHGNAPASAPAPVDMRCELWGVVDASSTLPPRECSLTATSSVTKRSKRGKREAASEQPTPSPATKRSKRGKSEAVSEQLTTSSVTKSKRGKRKAASEQPKNKRKTANERKSKRGTRSAKRKAKRNS